MAFTPQFLDELRARTPISALIARAVKLTKVGSEFKGCCPFHSEKSPSFTVSDAKGFAHCFGCGWHGDAFRWLEQHEGVSFPDAVKQLAAAAGMELPAPSPAEAQNHAAAQSVRAALETAQDVYADQLDRSGAVLEYLSGRGIGPAAVRSFGIGYARGGDGSLKGRGIGETLGREAGLLVERADGAGPNGSNLREQFWDRITVPIHDHRGALAGFGARVWPGRGTATPKFINSPDGPLFHKGSLLFNLHRAAPLARIASPSNPDGENRLIVVEGYFDVIALAQAGIGAVVAPMGTALTEAQLQRAWRVHHRPVLLFDGDGAGRKAALRACETALAGIGGCGIGPGRALAVALLPDGPNGEKRDPDDLLRALGAEAGAVAIEALVDEARPLHAFVFEVYCAELTERTPEAVAALWLRLAELAGRIADDETRAQYLGVWRARFEREVSAAEPLAAAGPLHAVIRAAPDPITGSQPDYAFPESESDSAARLIAIVRAALRKRAARREITEELADLMKMAEAIGFVKSQITAVIRDIESDLAHRAGVREEAEMVQVLYRRTLGIRGPMSEAMLPSVIDARPRAISATVKRRAAMNALIDARALQV